MSFPTSIPHSSVQFDRLEISLEGWRLIGDQEAIDNALGSLGARTLSPLETLPPAFGTLERITSTRRRVRILTPQPGSNGTHDAPLFAGNIEVRRGGQLGDSNGPPREHPSYNVNVELILNPTRFTRHLMARRYPVLLPLEVAPAQYGELFREPMLAASRSRQGLSHVDEWSLVDPLSDNFYPLIRGLPRTFRSFFSDSLRAYIEALFSLLQITFSQFSLVDVVVQSTRPRLTLRKAEAYIELPSADALQYVTANQGQFLRLHNDARRRFVPLRAELAEVRQEQNSPVVDVHILSGRRLVIYAKTMRRVRFEIRFDFKKCPQVLNGRFSCTEEGTSENHLSGVTERLFQWLETVRSQTALRLEILAPRMPAVGPSTNSAPVYRLMRIISEACTSSDMADHILSLLVGNAAIAVHRTAPELPAVEALERHGVLHQLSSRPATYGPTPEYERAIEACRRLEIGIEFLGGEPAEAS